MFVTDRERVVKVDALQLHTDEVEALKAEAPEKGAKKAGK